MGFTSSQPILVGVENIHLPGNFEMFKYNIHGVIWKDNVAYTFLSSCFTLWLFPVGVKILSCSSYDSVAWFMEA